MRKFKISTVSAIAVYAMLAVVLSSCTEHRDNIHRTESGSNSAVESGIALVGRYEVTESGMRYIVYREISGGLCIINITKDSLETELARKRLSENNR